MKNDKKLILGKKFGNNLINQLYKTNGVVSVTIVGSFSQFYNIDKIGDLDVVIICKKISVELINSVKKKIKEVNAKHLITKKKLKINDTFGPVKYDAKTYFTIHAMIYDIKGHIEHAIKSPFTCYDWQRSNWHKGKKLEKIFPVKNIYFRDFFEARRGTNDYLTDLKKNNISIRKYQIKNKFIYLKKINYKIDEKNKGEFVFHIISNLINNYNKFYINKNVKISAKDFKKLFLKITNNNKALFNKFELIKKEKNNFTPDYPKESYHLAKTFLKYFHLFLKKELKKYKQIVFLRHAKTSLNDNTFLGQGRDPDILKKSIKFNIKEKYDLIYSSPLKRSISTAKLFGKKKLIINNLLKEINYGKAEGLTLKEYRKKFPKKLKSWHSGIDTKFPDGENTKDVLKRVLTFIKSEIINKYPKNSKIIVVTHNVFLRCLIGHFLKIDLKNFFKININHMEKINFIMKGNVVYPNFKRQELAKLLLMSND